jgi:hypothetical protein
MRDEPVTLDILAAQQRKLLDEMRSEFRDTRSQIGGMRDEMRVLTAIVLRLENSQAPMLEQLRAMVQQHGRFSDRLRAVEERLDPSAT